MIFLIAFVHARKFCADDPAFPARKCVRGPSPDTSARRRKTSMGQRTAPTAWPVSAAVFSAEAIEYGGHSKGPDSLRLPGKPGKS